MRIQSLLVLVLAIVLGIASVFLARQWLEGTARTAAETGPGVELSTVVVARVPLYFGAKLAEENLKEVAWPADSRPEGSFTSIDELVSAEDERVVLRGIEANEPVLSSKISGFGGRATLSAVIADDMRAVTIRVNDVNGVAGFVLPGDRVDVMITRETGRDEAVTDMLLQNVKVLGVDQEASDQKEKPVVARAVTLEVSPIQAQKLTLGQTVGSLSLSLRNVLNVDAAATRTVTLADLGFGEMVDSPAKGDEPAAVAAPAPPARDSRPTVRIVRGMEESEERVGRDRGLRLAPSPVRLHPAPAPAPAPEPTPEGAPEVSAPLAMAPRS